MTVVESASELGGLLAGRYYNEHDIYFDQGTHIFQETGNPELDLCLQSCLPSEDLILMSAQEGDLSGCLFNGTLQTNSHFPDLRGRELFNDVVVELRHNALNRTELPHLDRHSPIVPAAERWFGKAYTHEVLSPILTHLYQHPADQLSVFSMILPGLTRSIIDSDLAWIEFSASAKYRAVIGYPEQRELPDQFRHRRRSYYARNLGSKALIDGLAAWLSSNDVSLLTGTTVVGLSLDDCHIDIQNGSAEVQRIQFDHMITSVGAVSTAKILGIPFHKYGFDRAMPHWIINIELDRPVELDLCYMYGFDTSASWYRLTNYGRFSGDMNDRRITLEVIGNREVAEQGLADRLINELVNSGVLKHRDYRFADAFRLKAGFPSPSAKNLQALAEIASDVRKVLPPNVSLCGTGALPGLFFQNEVVSHAYATAGEVR